MNPPDMFPQDSPDFLDILQDVPERTHRRCCVRPPYVPDLEADVETELNHLRLMLTDPNPTYTVLKQAENTLQNLGARYLIRFQQFCEKPISL